MVSNTGRSRNRGREGLGGGGGLKGTGDNCGRKHQLSNYPENSLSRSTQAKRGEISNVEKKIVLCKMAA